MRSDQPGKVGNLFMYITDFGSFWNTYAHSAHKACNASITDLSLCHLINMVNIF